MENSKTVNPPMGCVLCRDCPIGGQFRSHYAGGGSGGGPNHKCMAVEALVDINRSLSAMGALVENLLVPIKIIAEGNTTLNKPVMINTALGEPPV